MKFNVIVLFCFSMLASLVAGGQTDRKYIREGNSEYKKKNFSEAETKYRKSLEQNAQSYEGNYNLGNALYKSGKHEEAIKYFSGSAELGSDKKLKENAYYNLGNSFLKSEKYQESVDAYKQALKANPEDEQARYNLAYALAKLRQQQQKKDQNKDQKKENQDKKKQDQQKKQQDQKKQEQDQANKQPKKGQPKISKEDAERMLQALKNEEKNLQKKLAKRVEGTTGNPEKDW